MAEYFQALKHVRDDRYVYTVRTDDPVSGPFAIGYCTEYRGTEPSHAPRYHTTGHATEQEAIDCYKQYKLDHYLKLEPNPMHSQIQRKCEVCGVWTGGYALLGGMSHKSWHLCLEHCTKEQVTALYLK